MIGHVAVIVPARDEEDLIGGAIAAIDRARRALGPHITSSCVVVADSCADRTVDVVMASTSTTLLTELVAVQVRNVGAARGVGTRVALEGANRPLRSVWLANTDADTIVPDDWLTAQVHLANAGAEAVAGVVTLPPDETDTALLARFQAAYRWNPDGTHGHVHGANLGIRADVYAAAGGWSALATGEDHDLVVRLGTARVERTIALRVQTSARRMGRAPSGFADDLAAHATAGIVGVA